MNERWTVGERVFMSDADKTRYGEIVGFPKVHNAALAWVIWDGNKRKMSVPLILLEKAK